VTPCSISLANLTAVMFKVPRGSRRLSSKNPPRYMIYSHRSNFGKNSRYPFRNSYHFNSPPSTLRANRLQLVIMNYNKRVLVVQRGTDNTNYEVSARRLPIKLVNTRTAHGAVQPLAHTTKRLKSRYPIDTGPAPLFSLLHTVI
jgi:hypothetical protein